MSDTIIVYYSLEGNVDFLCRAFAKSREADLAGKEIFAIVSSAGGSSEKCLAQISKALEEKGCSLKDSISFVNPIKVAEDALEKIKAFAQKIS